MDWSELALLLLFVAFPLLQQLLQRRSAPPPPDAEPDEAPMSLEGRPDFLPEAGRRRAAERRDEWEERYREAADLAGREVIDEEEAARLVDLQSRLPAETVPEAIRVSSPVVSMETARREQRRQPSARVERSQSRGVSRAGPDASERPSALLRGPGQLRRAILTSEILGPPKSLE